MYFLFFMTYRWRVRLFELKKSFSSTYCSFNFGVGGNVVSHNLAISMLMYIHYGVFQSFVVCSVCRSNLSMIWIIQYMLWVFTLVKIGPTVISFLGVGGKITLNIFLISTLRYAFFGFIQFIIAYSMHCRNLSKI